MIVYPSAGKIASSAESVHGRLRDSISRSNCVALLRLLSVPGGKGVASHRLLPVEALPTIGVAPMVAPEATTGVSSHFRAPDKAIGVDCIDDDAGTTTGVSSQRFFLVPFDAGGGFCKEASSQEFFEATDSVSVTTSTDACWRALSVCSGAEASHRRRLRRASDASPGALSP